LQRNEINVRSLQAWHSAANEEISTVLREGKTPD
jgi:hypothetical protein